MNTYNEFINQELAKEQAKRRAKAQEQHEKRKREEIETCIYIRIGKLVSKYFPEVMHFKLQRKEADNIVEFEPLEKLLSELSKDKDYIKSLKERNG